MKVFIFLAVVVAVRGAALHYAPAAAVLETGASAQFRSEDNQGNYDFGYNEDHTSGGTFRREAGDAHGNVAGSYGLRDADGRVRIVNYIANDDGFRADIKTNEPGVEPQDPADATINKADVIAVQATVPVALAAPAPFVAVPEHAPVVLQEQVAVKSAYTFPAPGPVAVKSSSLTYSAPVAIPAPVALARPISAPLAIAEPAPLSYAFPPVSVPVAKTSVAVAEAAPLSYAFPAVSAPIAKTSVAIAEPAPLSYAFPPVSIPVAKTSVAVAEAAPLSYAFPAVSAPIAKTSVAIAEPAPLSYAFPPVSVPVAKTSVAVAEAAPLSYTFPAVSAPVAKTVAVAETAPLSYAFPPVSAPIAKTSVAVAETAPLAYTFPAVSAPVAKSSLAYAPAPLAIAAPARVSYSSQVQVNHGPSYAYAPGHVAYAAPASYAHTHYAPTGVALNSAYHYAATNNPFYYGLHSPVVSYAGPVPHFTNIEYPGYPVVKK